MWQKDSHNSADIAHIRKLWTVNFRWKMQMYHILNANCCSAVASQGPMQGRILRSSSDYREEYHYWLLMGTLAKRESSLSHSKNKNWAEIIIPFDSLLLYMKELQVFRHRNCSNEHIASEKNVGTFLFHIVIRNYKNNNKVPFQTSRNFCFFW